jgi:hypothetical protein
MEETTDKGSILISCPNLGNETNWFDLVCLRGLRSSLRFRALGEHSIRTPGTLISSLSGETI